jgi:hypothetical protein
MLDRASAEKLVLAFLNHGPGRVTYRGEVLELVVTSVEEKSYGWVFHYQSKRWLETRIVSWGVAGNGPIIVNKFDGMLHVTGTAYPLDHYLAEYERRLQRHPMTDQSREAMSDDGVSGQDG